MTDFFPSLRQQAQGKSPRQILQSRYFEMPILAKSRFRQTSLPRNISKFMKLENPSSTNAHLSEKRKLSRTKIFTPRLSISHKTSSFKLPGHLPSKERSISELGTIERDQSHYEKLINAILKPCQLNKHRQEPIKFDLEISIKEKMQTQKLPEKEQESCKPLRTAIFSKFTPR